MWWLEYKEDQFFIFVLVGYFIHFLIRPRVAAAAAALEVFISAIFFFFLCFVVLFAF